jgi:hypothetical protein
MLDFGYLMHLVGYLYEDYYDARSLEHKVGEFLEHMRERQPLRGILPFLVPVRINHECLRRTDVRTSNFCETGGVHSGINKDSSLLRFYDALTAKAIDVAKTLIFSETSVSVEVSTDCNIKTDLHILCSVYFIIRHSSCLCSVFQVKTYTVQSPSYN